MEVVDCTTGGDSDTDTDTDGDSEPENDEEGRPLSVCSQLRFCLPVLPPLIIEQTPIRSHFDLEDFGFDEILENCDGVSSGKHTPWIWE